jgi:hypothetical protein
MGKRNGESISNEPGGTEEGLSAWSFLGLCERDWLRAYPQVTSHRRTTRLMQSAALLSKGTRSWSASALWQAVSNDSEKTHNSQMDIVLALWKNDLIVRNS